MSFCVHVVGPRTTRGLQLDRALASAALIGSQNVTVYSMSDAAKALDAARSRLGLPTDTDLGDICLRDGEHSSSNGSNNRKETVELKKQALLVITLCLAALGASCSQSPDPVGDHGAVIDQVQQEHLLGDREIRKRYLSLAFRTLCPAVPRPGPGGWGAGDEAGNTNTQGAGTACRAGLVQSLMAREGKLYRLDHVYEAGVSPSSPFGAPLEVITAPTFCLEPPLFPYATKFCGHSDQVTGDIGGQGTQLDFFGHAGRRADPLDPPSATTFYNGVGAPEVLGGALGGDKVRPINTIGVLLDARKLNGGAALGPTDVITKANVWQMLVDQDLAWLGFQPGMVVFVYTGKGAGWEHDPAYYLSGPGVAANVVTDIYAPNSIVLHGLDNPFSDQADLIGGVFASGTDPLDPFPVHAETLTRGILQVQNLNLEQLAELEEKIALVIPARDPEGELARAGAVRAAISANAPLRAAYLAKLYLKYTIDPIAAQGLRDLQLSAHQMWALDDVDRRLA